MRIDVSFLVLIVLTGCSLFKNTHTELQQSHAASSNKTDAQWWKENDLQRKSKVIVFHQDSNKQDYAIQLWPKGTFTFSREHGFSGEAEQILITGNVKGSSVWSALKSTEQLDKGKSAVKLSQQKKEVANMEDKIKTGTPSWKWMIGGLILIVLIGWIAYKKILH